MGRFDLAGRTALVTGGASGIGFALSGLLLNKGVVRLIVVGRDERRLNAAAGELGPRAEIICADLSNETDVARIVRQLPDLAPDLSLVINNAGSQLLTDFTAPDAATLLPALNAEIAANLAAVVALSVGLMPLLSHQRAAAVVNVTSGLALAPKTSSPVYCATKAGVHSFTRALRYQCESRAPHVRIIEALPPQVDTQMTAGRGRGKISPEACAAEIVAGIMAGQAEIYVGKAKLLRAIMRVAPALGYGIMRRG